MTMSNLFSSQGLYSAALFGILLMSAVMLAPEGVVGEIAGDSKSGDGRRSHAKVKPYARCKKRLDMTQIDASVMGFANREAGSLKVETLPNALAACASSTIQLQA